jgi:hypothetical protein
MQGIGGKFVAGLRAHQEDGELPQKLAKELTELGLQRRAKEIVRRSVEGARDREFRPVRPPLAPRMPTS